MNYFLSNFQGKIESCHQEMKYPFIVHYFVTLRNIDEYFSNKPQ